MARLTADARFDQTRMDLNVLSRNLVDVEFFDDVNLAIDGQPIEDVFLISYVDGGFDSSAYLGGRDFRLGSDGFSIMGTLNAVAIATESAGVTLQDWRISGLDTPLSDLVTAAESAGQADDRQFISRVLSGSDVFRLSGGDDRAMGLDGNDRMMGKGGDDSLQGNDGADTILGDGGTDLLWGGKGFDVLLGGSGADTLIDGMGNDRLFGGLGDDRLSLDIGADVINGGGGTDLLIFGGTRDIRIDLARTGAQDTGFGRDVITGIEIVSAGGGNDFLGGNGAANILRGDAGDDRMSGRGGNDLLEGGLGKDLITGNFGNDTLLGGNGADTVIGGGGQDQLLGGFGDDRLEGHAGSDQLTGGRGNDLLIGGRGRDLMTGGQGADVFKFNMLADSGRFAAGADVIQDFGVGRDRINLSAIDADMGVKGNQAFTLSLDGLSGQAGQLAMLIDADRTRVMIDIDGDATADMMISLIGQLDLGADDFIL